tara:strand:- start:448 stop:663 length:216 start_codon:yes stop_codon:yes gene_type:complete
MKTDKPLATINPQTTLNTDYERFVKERNAATQLRDDLCFLVGWTKADNPEISKKLDELLENHEKNRVQEWI